MKLPSPSRDAREAVAGLSGKLGQVG